MINKELARERNISEDTQSEIECRHRLRDKFVKVLTEESPDTVLFKVCLRAWRRNERDLQLLWGFEPDENKTREWHLPHCTCPKMDNDDFSYHRYVSEGCPLHDIK